MELCDLTIHQLDEMVRRGEVRCREIVESVLRRIERAEPQLHSFVTITAELALRSAELADREGRRSALAGVPLAVKDVICTRGVPTTCCSRILQGFVPPYDATVIERLRGAGYALVGKTNMDEFAMGSSTENSAFGPTRNPWDPERVPGGSSGGSAAAVAAGQCIAALGSDTGGSIRQPAAFCGIVGMKPTYGRVSRYGLVAFASSLDQIGPMTKDVRDCALLLRAISGPDPRDSTCAEAPVPDYAGWLGRPVRGLRAGVPREYLGGGLEEDVARAVREALRVLEGLGMALEEVRLPHTEYALPAYYIIAPAEASSNLARYDGVRYGYRADGREGLRRMYEETRSRGFGAEVKRRIMLGTYALSAGYYDAYYRKASQVRTLILRDFQEAFRRCEVIVGPTSPTTAFRLGERLADPLQMYLSDVLTVPANLAGLPALSLPCGFDRRGLPIGLQLIGRPFDEATLLQVAYAYEQSTEWHRRRPWS